VQGYPRTGSKKSNIVKPQKEGILGKDEIHPENPWELC
jgi:hypothetical protein